MLDRSLESKPGRKLLVWMGPGWPLLPGLKTNDSGAESTRRYYAAIVAVGASVRRAHVTLSSVEPLNLSQGTGAYAFLSQDYLKGVRKPEQADLPDLGLQVLAVHSGGQVLSKDGDLPAQINRCFADARSFYEVTFDAAPGDRVGIYHPLKMTVDSPGARVRTESAYYARQP